MFEEFFETRNLVLLADDFRRSASVRRNLSKKRAGIICAAAVELDLCTGVGHDAALARPLAGI